MLETLQTNDGSNGRVETPVRPATLVLNDEYIQTAIALIKSATSEIRLTAYAWRWYTDEPESGIQKLNMELYACRRRGVTVRAIVDTFTTREQMRAQGFDVKCVESKRTMHTKAISADCRSLLIGSHNMTKRANTDNFETSVLLHDFAPVVAYNEYFDKLWNIYG